MPPRPPPSTALLVGAVAEYLIIYGTNTIVDAAEDVMEEMEVSVEDGWVLDMYCTRKKSTAQKHCYVDQRKTLRALTYFFSIVVISGVTV